MNGLWNGRSCFTAQERVGRNKDAERNRFHSVDDGGSCADGDGATGMTEKYDLNCPQCDGPARLTDTTIVCRRGHRTAMTKRMQDDIRDSLRDAGAVG